MRFRAKARMFAPVVSSGRTNFLRMRARANGRLMPPLCDIGGDPRNERDDPDALKPDRFYVMSDAGSLYFDDAHADGFETPAAAAKWATAQTLWAYGCELDFSDGVTSVIVLGGEVNEANAAWQAWADMGGSGPYSEVEVHNYAIELGLGPSERPPP